MSDAPAPGILQQALRPQLGNIALAGVFGAFCAILLLTGPLFMLLVYEKVLQTRSEDTLLALFVLVTILLACFCALDHARGRILTRVGAGVRASLDETVFRVATRPDGDPGVLRDVDRLFRVFAGPAWQALADLPWAVVFAGVVALFHPLLGGIVIATACVLVALVGPMRALASPKNAKARVNEEKAAEIVVDARRARGFVQAQGMERALSGRFVNLRQAALQDLVRADDLAGSGLGFARGIRLYMQSVILAAGAYLVLSDGLTAGGMIAVSLLFGRAIAPLETVLVHWPEIRAAHAALRRLNALPAESPAAHPGTLSPPALPLALTGVVVADHARRQTLLRGINVNLNPGQIIGVVSDDDVARAALCGVAAGLIPPSAGKATLNCAPLEGLPRELLGERIGYLPSAPVLVPGTIAENIAGFAPASVEDLRSAIEDSGLDHVFDALPDGIATPSSSLSAQQQNQVARARAFFGSPALLVLDAPWDHLDARAATDLSKALRRFAGSCKAVLVTARLEEDLAGWTRLYRLSGGRLEPTVSRAAA